MDLRLTTLHSLHALNESPDQSTFAAHGADLDRISALSKSPPCECGCRVPLKILQKTCESFWSLPKASQDSLLWSLQAEEGSSRRTWSIEGPITWDYIHVLFSNSTQLEVWTCFVSETSWNWRGYAVCRLAWLRYLGIGKQRLGRCKRVFHGIDDRTISQGFVAAFWLESIKGNPKLRNRSWSVLEPKTVMTTMCSQI